MKRGPLVESGIYLRWDALNDFLGELAVLSTDAKARELRMSHLNLHRARRGAGVGHRTIAEILLGTARLARRRGVEAPAFEDLFEIETPARKAPASA